MAQNTLGSPPITADTAASTSAPSGQTKQAGKKRAAKSSSPHPAKRSLQSVRITSPPAVSGSVDVNSQLIQVVHSLSDTVKGLESKVSNFEKSFATSNLSANPSTRSLVISTDVPPPAGFSFSSCLPSTSSALPASHHTIQTPFQHVSAPPVTSNFSLSTALPAQEFGRRFVSPAAVTVSPQIRANIIQVHNFENRNLKNSSIRRLLAGIQFYASFYSFEYSGAQGGIVSVRPLRPRILVVSVASSPCGPSWSCGRSRPRLRVAHRGRVADRGLVSVWPDRGLVSVWPIVIVWPIAASSPCGPSWSCGRSRPRLRVAHRGRAADRGLVSVWPDRGLVSVWPDRGLVSVWPNRGLVSVWPIVVVWPMAASSPCGPIAASSPCGPSWSCGRSRPRLRVAHRGRVADRGLVSVWPIVVV
ncbi:hypothetical protein DPX16_17248 [Anabarilius grahami]|uniref:Uncharacterized protein n=1 Tax=Anabarilius grahami TaxID=495550 RepID=A0A3N0YB33_ANAGA|nr:hypothetical protein DPX16_17248 [Anabarilius grahami]